MQIKINLDQIFGSSNNDQTASHSSFDSYQVSQIGSQSISSNPYKIKIPIFNDQVVQTTKPSPKIHQKKAPSVVSIQTQQSQKSVGDRLYYQSLNNMARKNKQLQRLKLEKIQAEQKQITFKPQINKNSQKILANKGKPHYQKPSTKKQSTKMIPTHIRKQQQQIMHCTFKPQLVAKYSTGFIRNKQKDQIFQQLFNDHKIKFVKQKMKTQQAQRQKQRQKKLSKVQFQKFLQRNNQFINKVQKKNQLIITTSKKFDLQTGQKMFSPKTNSVNSHKKYFTNLKPQLPSQIKQNSNSQIKTKPIFAKYQEESQQYQKPTFRINTQYNRSLEPSNNIFKKFNKINQVRQDQQDEIAQQQPNFQEIKQFDASPQSYKHSDEQSFEKEEVHSIHNFDKYSFGRQRQQNNLGFQDNLQKESNRDSNVHYESVESQLFNKSGEQKHSDQGQTHQGEQSKEYQ